jgi:hypothetical protein
MHLRAELGTCISNYGCHDQDQARDFLRSYACSIYDSLKEAYSQKITVWDWEEEIAQEAIRITLACWNNFNVSPPNSYWEPVLHRAIAQHVGRPLRKHVPQSALVHAFASSTASESQPEVKLPSRREFVESILEQKGWSILDWANEAEVAHATAMDYLDEKTRPYRSTRLKLAKGLGISVDRLPK